MTVRTSTYAALSDNAYSDREVVAGRHRDEHRAALDGVLFNVLKHVDSIRTGYQGAIYQRADTGEIIVAHRGTESAKDVLADLSMVRARVNPQAQGCY